MEEQKNDNLSNEALQYKNIQFIGLCLSTTPGDLKSIEGMSDDGRYLGDPDMESDIDARMSLVAKLISEIHPAVTKNNETLNVFVLPEFFFRGSTGAYLRSGKENPYQFFTTKFGSLIRFMKDYENCLLVAGSVLSSTIAYDKNEEKEPGKSLIETGDNLLDIYYRLYPKQEEGAEGSNHPSMHELLKMIDQGTNEELDKLSEKDDAFVDVLRKTLDYCDATTNLVVDNSTYVIFGGKNALAPMRIPKKYKSKEDFVLNRYFTVNTIPTRTGYLQSNTKYAPISGSELKSNVSDTGAIFYYGGIWFGIDICLDHSRQRLVDELKIKSKRFVDVQIITSCGMEIKENAVTAKQGNWVFNCDGEYMLENTDKGVDGPNCHSSLRKVTGQLTVDDKGNVTQAAVLSNAESTIHKEPIKYTIPEGFYPATECHVHIYAPHPVHEPVIQK